MAAVAPVAVSALTIEPGDRRMVATGSAKTDAGWSMVAGLDRQRASGLSGGVLIGYARCSTDRQDLSAQRATLRDLGVSEDRVFLDHGLTGRNRNRPGLQQALAALREGDTLGVPKLDRLARSGAGRQSDQRFARRPRCPAVGRRHRL
jgi:hypothetical protein